MVRHPNIKGQNPPGAVVSLGSVDKGGESAMLAALGVDVSFAEPAALRGASENRVVKVVAGKGFPNILAGSLAKLPVPVVYDIASPGDWGETTFGENSFVVAGLEDGGGPDEAASAAVEILARGAGSVIITGCGKSGKESSDYFRDSASDFWLTTERVDSKAGGKRGALAASIAGGLALGLDRRDSAVLARMVLQGGMRNGGGNRLVPRFPSSHEDMPWVSRDLELNESLEKFPGLDNEGVELYPVVDSSDWVVKLLGLGVKTLQLRIKGVAGGELENEIVKSVKAAEGKGARLFINDYWELAIKHGAYGVHLGQEDLVEADIAAIRRAGTRLGISTHCYYEGAVAHALRPSYVAFGPVYFTKLKAMAFAPQGVGLLKLWRGLFDCPLVAIGGITLEQADELLGARPDFISVVRDITQAPDVERRVKDWFRKLGRA